MILFTSLFLVLVNLIPLYGVFALDWSVGLLLFFYWTESSIIGFFTVLKMFMVRAELWRKIFLTVFFLIHFGGFMLGHLFFLIMFVMPADGPLKGQLDDPSVLWVQIKWTYFALFVSHLVSFFGNYVRNKEYLGADLEKTMVAVYGRIGLFHVVVLGGGIIYVNFFEEGADASLLFMSIAVGLKLSLDLFAHLRSHRHLQKR